MSVRLPLSFRFLNTDFVEDGFEKPFFFQSGRLWKITACSFNSKWTVAKQTKLETKGIKTIQREFACGPLENGLSQNALIGLLSWMFVQIIKSHVSVEVLASFY